MSETILQVAETNTVCLSGAYVDLYPAAGATQAAQVSHGPSCGLPADSSSILACWHQHFAFLIWLFKIKCHKKFVCRRFAPITTQLHLQLSSY